MFYLVFHKVSRFIHLTQMVVIYWLLTEWIINEFDNNSSKIFKVSIKWPRMFTNRNFHKTSRSTFALALFWSNKVSAFVCISSFERASCVYGVLTPGMSGSPPDSSNLTLPVLLLLLKSRSFQANVKRHCVGSEFPNSTQLNFIRNIFANTTHKRLVRRLINYWKTWGAAPGTSDLFESYVRSHVKSLLKLNKGKSKTN